MVEGQLLQDDSVLHCVCLPAEGGDGGGPGGRQQHYQESVLDVFKLSNLASLK